MKNLIKITLAAIILFVQSTALQAQDNQREDAMVELLNGKDSYRHTGVSEQIKSSVNYLKSQRLKYQTELEYAKFVYDYLGSSFQNNYKEYTNLDDLIKDGDYNCVSATWLYAYVYGQLGYQYSIYETETHVYMKLLLINKDVLLESTTPGMGFIDDAEMIQNKVNQYLTLSPDNFIKKISLKQLAGLQYYNNAVKQYNTKQYNLVSHWLKCAAEFYPCERVNSLNNLSQDSNQKVAILK